ncbi:type IV toxin-antitoxin system AbiEi family antitoxin domain-containing protein [Agromyces agglutinans]|uniref:type IV toxin-antitoxin system AbiEi family antitoxin domain-containing protein n=1 Tax=Agromyces agglutinans TaxID=2662258 RepID=UPI001562833E|nr:type IV toxin-antitoxin system AbiEi family antitoxin domain-containing protein [Agromyces agglutinans]
MHDELQALAAAHPAGLIRAARLTEVGWHPSTVERMTRAGVLVRVRRGVYAAGPAWRAAGVDERYRLRIHAEALEARSTLCVSHRSAAAFHGLPAVGRWPDAVETTAVSATGGRSGGRRSVHRAGPAPEWVVIDGVRVTSLVRTLADVSITSPMRVSVPMLDAALRAHAPGLRMGRSRDLPPVPTPAPTPARVRARSGAAPASFDLRAQVLAEIAAIDPVRGRRRAEASVRFADARAENAGESLSRVVIHESGFVAPDLQVQIDGVLGSYAIADFLWRGIRRIGEFDGTQKYLRSREVSGLDPATVVFREKQREDALRRLGFGMTRWDWAMLMQPTRLAALLRDAGVPLRA